MIILYILSIFVYTCDIRLPEWSSVSYTRHSESAA